MDLFLKSLDSWIFRMYERSYAFPRSDAVSVVVSRWNWLLPNERLMKLKYFYWGTFFYANQHWSDAKKCQACGTSFLSWWTHLLPKIKYFFLMSIIIWQPIWSHLILFDETPHTICQLINHGKFKMRENDLSFRQLNEDGSSLISTNIWAI